MDNSTGKAGEEYAADFLHKKGYEILERNFHSRFGEIDIIAKNAKYLVFVEVKTREPGSLSDPLESVTLSKQHKLARTALLYLQTHPSTLQPRFDVIGITMDVQRNVFKIRYIINAFDTSAYY